MKPPLVTRVWIDNDDGEWIGEVSAIKTGKSPFGESKEGLGSSDFGRTLISGELVKFD